MMVRNLLYLPVLIPLIWLMPLILPQNDEFSQKNAEYSFYSFGLVITRGPVSYPLGCGHVDPRMGP